MKKNDARKNGRGGLINKILQIKNPATTHFFLDFAPILIKRSFRCSTIDSNK